MLRIVILPKPTWQAQKGDKKWEKTLSTNFVPWAFPLRNGPWGQGCLSTPTYDAG